MPAIGSTAEDGSILVGTLDDGKSLLAVPCDAEDSNGVALRLSFNEASRYVQELNEQAYLGHQDWRLPSLHELAIINKNKEALKDAGLIPNNYPVTEGYLAADTFMVKGTLRRTALRNRMLIALPEERMQAPVRCVRAEDTAAEKEAARHSEDLTKQGRLKNVAPRVSFKKK